MQVTVLGGGYVGLTTAACLAHLGHSVAIFEADARRAEALSRGIVPFHEPGLPDLVSEALGTARMRPVGSSAVAMENAELVLVCVGTPLDRDGEADLSQVESACRSIAEHAPRTPVVIRSTLPLGETRALATWLGRADLGEVVTNPEFLRQGSAVVDFLNPTRVVIGTDDGSTNRAAGLLLDLYAAIEAPVLVTDFNSAEMIKNAANAFLATKLSFINEVADLCEAYDADIRDVARGIGLDPRIGSTYLSPGIGFGGSCLPKELANMVRLGRKRGLQIPLMGGAAQTNEERTEHIADRIELLISPVHGCRVALLGLAFKANTDDTRYSPALAIAERLASRGATVVAHDPAVPHERTAGVAGLERAPDAETAMAGADLVVLATEWPEYAALDWPRLAGRVRRPVVFDGRNLLDAGALRRAGWQVIQVGRSAA
jgi:UDPglucose 6-dehydrogenase